MVDSDAAEQMGFKIKSKVILLLTDGRNDVGEYDPLAAAELAQLSQLGGQIAISKIFFPYNASIMPQMVSNPTW